MYYSVAEINVDTNLICTSAYFNTVHRIRWEDNNQKHLVSMTSNLASCRLIIFKRMKIWNIFEFTNCRVFWSFWNNAIVWHQRTINSRVWQSLIHCMLKLSFFSPLNTKTNLRMSKWQNVHFCVAFLQNPNLCNKSQTTPWKNRLYIILFIVVFYVVVVVDVLMFLDCVQISSCELCGVWHCDCGDVPCLVSLRTHGQTLIRHTGITFDQIRISLIIIV